MKRLLYIAHRVPYPPDKGERLRAYHQIRALAEHFRVVVAALAHSRQEIDSAGELREWCEGVLIARAGGKAGLLRGALSLLAGRSATQGYFHSSRLRRMIDDEAARTPFDLAMGSSSSTLPYVLAAPAPARALDLIDVDSAKWLGFAKVSGWPKSWLYRREAAAVGELERRAVERCDVVFLVSQAECDALGSASDKVVPVGNGVDTTYFRPDAVPPLDLGPACLVFTGQMDYRPNVEGVCWFARHVWPDLKRDCPEATWCIVGRQPTRDITQLADLPGVTVTGSVPDVRPYLAAAKIAVCPLQLARGIQNKVLEAMAMGKPVVASGPSLEGLDLAVGQDALQADAPADWRRLISGLLADGEHRDRLGRQARRCVETNYTWAARLRPLVSVCGELSARPVAGSSGSPAKTAAEPSSGVAAEAIRP